jgi:uncharacterized protein YkwD
VALRENGELEMLIWLLIAFFVLVAPAVATGEDGEKNTAVIYRTAEKPVISHYLGVGTLPVVVVINGKRHPGLYITTPPAGLAGKMGLVKGSVLLTMDGYSMTSTRAADDWLAHRAQTPIKYAYVIVKDSKPLIYAGEVLFTHSPAITAFMNSSGQSSLEELERYGFSLINDSRRAEGKSQLESDSALCRLARSYADYMRDHADQYGFPLKRNPHFDLQGRMPMQRAFEAGIMTEVHENLGMESRANGRDAELVLRQHHKMMSEPQGEHNHRSIIMDQAARRVGVGIARDGQHLFLVEEFGH